MSLSENFNQILTKLIKENNEKGLLLEHKFFFLVLTKLDKLIYLETRPYNFNNYKGIWIFNAKILWDRLHRRSNEREYDIDIFCVSDNGTQEYLKINDWEISISGYYSYWNIGNCLRLFAKNNNLEFEIKAASCELIPKRWSSIMSLLKAENQEQIQSIMDKHVELEHFVSLYNTYFLTYTD